MSQNTLMGGSPTDWPSGSIKYIPDVSDGSAVRASLHVLNMAFLVAKEFDSLLLLVACSSNSNFTTFSCKMSCVANFCYFNWIQFGNREKVNLHVADLWLSRVPLIEPLYFLGLFSGHPKNSMGKSINLKKGMFIFLRSWFLFVVVVLEFHQKMRGHPRSSRMQMLIILGDKGKLRN